MTTGNSLSFKELAPPTSQQEDWRYTPLRSFESKTFEILNWIDRKAWSTDEALSALDLLAFSGSDGDRLFPNSRLQSPFRKFFSHQLQAQEMWFLRQQIRGVLTQIETLLRVPKSGKLLILLESSEDSFAQLNLRVRLEESQQLDLFVCMNGAVNSFNRIQLQVEMSAGSRLLSNSLLLGGRVNRLEQEVIFTAPGACAELSGLSLATGDQVQDQQTRIQHRVGGCQSQQLFKALLSDHARTVYSGSVHIFKGAVGAESHQLNQNLILGNQAEAISLPRLEIDADDVVATHGSTTGSLNDEEIFYLQSRGLGKEEARRMILAAFGEDILSRVPRVLLQPIRPIYDRALLEMRGSV